MVDFQLEVIESDSSVRVNGSVHWGAAEASQTQFYLSANSSFDASDVLLGSREVPVLSAGATSAGSTGVTIPAGTAAGTWYLIARADGPGALAETFESNNTMVRSIQVTAP